MVRVRKPASRSLTMAASSVLYMSAAACNMQSASESEPHEAISVRSGRLVFEDVQAFSAMITELNELPKGTQPAEHIETTFAGFRPLGSSSPEVQNPVVLRGILNGDKLFQIGDDIHLLEGRLEYVVPEGNTWIIPELISGAAAEDYVAAGLIKTYGHASASPAVPSQVRDDAPRSLLNAKYQNEFRGLFNNILYKFVDEAYIDNFSTHTQVCIRLKFEYLKRSSWRAAGEQVFKQILNGVASAALSDGSRTEHFISGEETSSTNLTSCAVFSPAPGHCVSDFQIDAELTSRVRLPESHNYVVLAEWDSEFDSVRKCN